MLNRLNYYSRYNRIKSPKEIQTLYHLVDDLNLDAIVTDDLIQRVSNLRDGHYQHGYREQFKTNGRFQYGGGGGVQLDLKGLERSSGNRRSGSYDKNSSARSGNTLRQQIMQYLKQNTSRESQNRNAIYEQPQTYTQRPQNQKSSVQGQENKSSQQQQKQPQSRNKTNTLSQMNVLQTQSIPQSQKQVQHHPQSPINKLQAQSHEDHEQIASQFFQTNQKDVQYLKSSNFGDEFSEGLAELHKVDDVRNSSYYKQDHETNSGIRHKQFIDQECRSEKLYRFYGSDLQMGGTDREDEIEGDYDQHHINPTNQIFIEQQTQENKEIPIMVPVEMVFNQAQSRLQEQDHHYQGKNFDHEDNDSQYDSAEEEFRKKQQTSIDNRISKKNQQEGDQQSGTIKIPSKGLTQGKWPIGGTQKSIEGVIQNELSPLPSTLIQNSGLAQKERKPFKKMMMDRKLNPRMVTSTIVNDVPAPVKKVNFKKMIKKESAENRAVKQLTPQNKKPKQFKPIEEKKQLLKAFFDQN